MNSAIADNNCHSLILIFSLVLSVGLATPAFAQLAQDIVINEVDINPSGDDSKSIIEWIEIYNPTDSDVNLSGWKIASTTALQKTMIIQSGTIIKPGQFLTYSYQNIWFADVGESVELRDRGNILVDKTPVISDTKNDFTSWQRLYDGYDSDSSDDWKFVSSTTGASNGMILVVQESDGVTVDIASEKPFYKFGEVAKFSGSVSKEEFIVKPFFKPQQIEITITGSNFEKTIKLYPDHNLNFETTLSLHQVLGIDEGTYDVTVSYAGATSSADFAVGYEVLEDKVQEDSDFDIFTDKSLYIPGQTVSLTGLVTDIIPFESMKFTITDAGGDLVANGNLFPIKGEFLTRVFISTVSPSYGTYGVSATYSDKSAEITFKVAEDLKDDVLISLSTDKSAYSPGEKVTISGRLNQIWINTLDLEVLQTKQSSIGSSSFGSDAGFKILDGVRIEGDGTFAYEFTIPNHKNRLGDYRINVSKDIGAATVVIHAVENPDEFVASTDPLTISSDESMYEIGDAVILSGFVKDPFSNSSYGTGATVNVSIAHEDGTPLEIIGLPNNAKTRINDGLVVAYDFTAIPETSGQYSLAIDLSQSIFSAGNYVVTSKYLDHVATLTFTILSPLDLSGGSVISLEKEIYGLGETVNLSGIVPPTGEGSVVISLTKPDGSTANSGATVDNQRFTWSWTTPVQEKVQTIKTDDRDVTKSNFGVYKIKVSTPSESTDLFFKVSKDPQNDSLSTTPIFVSTEKSLYKSGEKLKVVGNVIERQQGNEGLVVPERIKIKVYSGTFPYKQIHESSVYPTQGGDFSSIFELPSTIFSEGPYKVTASYLTVSDETMFSVTNDFVFGIDEDIALLLSTDKPVYHPGDTVVIDGKPNKLIYLEKFDVSILQKSDMEISCGSFYCGTNTGPIVSLRPSPSGSFSHQYVIPDELSAIGSYEVTVDADFETASVVFNVVKVPKLGTVIEKENRIAKKMITITTKEKTGTDGSFSPRVISGSLITSARGDESAVNLRITTAASGVCIIGPDAGCLVDKSTRKQGQIYDVVKVDGMTLNVRYSGPDVRLEKFSIVPESSDEFLPDADWNVEIIKEEQVSRFYYKVIYKPTQ